MLEAEPLDATWSLTVNGRTVQANPDGSFRIPNISAADSFGRGGPGTAPDFLSDDFLRLIGTRTVDGKTEYVFSDRFQIRQGQTFTIGKLTYTPMPPPSPESLTVTAPTPLLMVGDTTQLAVIGTLGDGSQADLTQRSAWTVYRTSNPGVATVGEDGLVTATGPGRVFLTAINEGTTAVLGILVAEEVTTTTVEGRVVTEDGTPVIGAEVTLFGQVASSGAPDGLFTFPDITVPEGEDLLVTVFAEVGGEQLFGFSEPAAVVANGITDVGIVAVRPGLRYPEIDGRVVAEAELYTRRTAHAASGTNWLVVPDEHPGAGPRIASARGGKYVQSLPDNSTGGGPLVPPSIEYEMLISTPGAYRLYLRWDGNASSTSSGGQSDSIFVDIVELKDGSGGAIADWYELVDTVDGNFAARPWDAGGGFEQNTVISSNGAMTWVIDTPGIYTLRITQREDGSAVDAFVFQLSGLPAPAGDGPPVTGF